MLAGLAHARATSRTIFRGTRWDKRLYGAMYLLYALLFLGFAIHPGKGGVALRIAASVIIAVLLTLGAQDGCPS